jgi:hypothetical protein
MKSFYVMAAMFISLNLSAQLFKDTTKWYDKIQLRGYAQVRYNGLLQTNEYLECEQCDKSWGG